MTTELPIELPKAYEPADCQTRWVDHWLSHGYCNADPNPDKKSHTIMIPLPNVTGALHMGHCLNGTIQDLLTRWRRMQGREALWMPGTDHAGIATQAVVERRMLEEEGKTRHDVGRDKLVERIWKWKDEYEARILNQLKQIGSSCDWRRVRFTLDEVCSKAVRRTFFKMFSDGLIYRGKRLVNWDTYLQTAVADDEVYTEDIPGNFWTMNYPVVENVGVRSANASPFAERKATIDDNWQPTGQRISFSTTRPETMLGDTAICVHPTDERYTDLIGKHVMIPANGRIIPIIADALLADKTLGTGAVKVTPAHDPNDYACWTRNKDAMGAPINILNPDGRLNENGSEFAGLDRYEARKRVVAKMESLGNLEKVEDRVIPMKYSDRSKTPIEPFLSDQWFVKMDKLAQDAIDAVEDGRVRFFPQRYAKTYIDWLAEKRDWCISRQLWWGHRIPVWTKVYESDDPGDHAIAVQLDLLYTVDEVPDERATIYDDEEASRSLSVDTSNSCLSATLKNGGIILRNRLADTLTVAFERVPDNEKLKWKDVCRVCVSEGNPDIEAKLEACGFIQDPDVLDTWFSSALWPHATLGWPDLEHDPPMQPTAGAASQISDAKSQIESQGFTTKGTESTEGNRRGGEQGGKTTIQNSVPSSVSSVTSVVPTATPSRNRVLDFFYPGSILVTSRDIITLWVARMVLTGLYNMGDIPFSHVYIHPKILDGLGQTMSKSKGNGVDPLELIEKYGTDAVRFTIASLCGETQDVRMPVGYECPHCQAVTPQTKEHQDMKPMGGLKLPFKKVSGTLEAPENADEDDMPESSRHLFQHAAKPSIKCAKCKKTFQFPSPWFTPDEGAPVARIVSERFEYGRNFCNKLWNACRFAFMNLEGYTAGPIQESELAVEDRWVFSRLATTVREVTTMLDRYQFDQATRAAREFTWNEFCDWYLEMLKPRFRDEAARPVAQRCLVFVVDTLLRLLHPFAPFITEELWHKLNELAPSRTTPASAKTGRAPTAAGEGKSASQSVGASPVFAPTESVMIAIWPDLSVTMVDTALEKRFERLQETIVAVRNIRSVYGIAPGAPLKLFMRCAPDVAEQLHAVAAQFDFLSKTMLEAAGLEINRPPGSASFSLGDADGYIPLEGVIDRKAEVARQNKEADKLRGFIAGHEKKLSNEGFLAKAPEKVIQEIRETLASLRSQLESVERIISDLS